MRVLREDTFSGNKNGDAYEHVERILDIVSLFNILGVTHDTVMLRVFPITLTRAAKRWVDKLSPRTINTWDLLKNAIIQRYCPPSKIAKQLEEIHNFKQKGDETLYQAWERRMSHDSSVRIAAITNKLDSLGRDMKKLEENVHVIQVECENYRGYHLNKECQLHEEVKSVEEVKYGEFRRTFPNNNRNGARYRVENLETQIEQQAKDYKVRAANEVPDLSVGQCKTIFANNEETTDEASSKGTIKL
ncbi:hypothetical protein Tco_0678977 [Tanacetum coccineum]|uniref:Retrotransposon gag domain-containing protein n=1 Tax=Tanacetum coccineum TaxID=301880 RepID=A0ABQ4XHI7_9ASTR